MRTYLDCIPCFCRQALDAARLVTDDEAIHERVLRQTLRSTGSIDFRRTPPEMGQQIHRLIRKLMGQTDPYSSIKDRWNLSALALYPRLKERVSGSDFPLETAVRLSIAGNIIDFGVTSQLGEAEVGHAINYCLTTPLSRAVLEEFCDAVHRAESILFIGDNAGEIVFDRLLIEQMPLDRITFAVRGAPVINDATMTDARTTGLCDIVEVVSNGSDAPGTVLKDCSDEFRRRFDKADLVVAKGQGNYETLSDIPKDVFFLMKVKCPVIAKDVGCPVGSAVVVRDRKPCERCDEGCCVSGDRGRRANGSPVRRNRLECQTPRGVRRV